MSEQEDQQAGAVSAVPAGSKALAPPYTSHFVVFQMSDGGWKEWQHLGESFDQFTARIQKMERDTDRCWIAGWFRCVSEEIEAPAASSTEEDDRG